MAGPQIRVQTRSTYGRPRMSRIANGAGGREQVRFNAELPLRRELNAIAIEDNVTLSEVVRRACREYVERRKQKGLL